MRICGKRCCLRYGHLCTHRCDEYWNWNLKDAMVTYGERKNYAGIIKDDEAKEPENKGLRCEDLYVRFAKAIRKEERKDEHVRQAEYVDAKEKKSGVCIQCSRKGHWCATGGR